MDPTHSQQSSFQNAQLLSGSEKFRATKLWNEVIDTVRERLTKPEAVSPANDRFGLSSSSSLFRPICFSGAQAVETLASFLAERRESMGLKEITEEKARKFCEILLRDNTIAPVPENREKNRFEASKTAFYYFADYCPSPSLRNESASPEMENCRRFMKPKSRQSVTSHASPLLSMKSAGSLECLDENIVRDFALSRLLTLVDIPVLEGIVHIRSDGDGGSVLLKSLENLFGGMKFSRRSESSNDGDAESVESTDPWIIAAHRCLQVSHKKVTSELGASRQSLYAAVVDAYQCMTSKRGPLIPHQYEEILAQISLLIRPGSEAKAAEACECLGLLLAKEIRRQLDSLLRFLVVIRDEKGRKQRVTAWIYGLEEGIFWKFIFPHRAADDDTLKVFCLKHAGDIFAAGTLREQRRRGRSALLDTTQASTAELTFCRRIAPDEYKRQQPMVTESALFETLSKVLDDERMSEKAKIEWLERFRTIYPNIYEARFGSST